ncbi:glutathione hydrolase 6 [Brienomyrus brachyistius]|uniref:glutathione hydrolase 6 n=1 Tax=Brienomyrus brachyistius TaxID=42636 RepID=UPI0020B43F24|nr:glutathione hydrolase 6 [Brienomyrus brachyistius]
MVSNTSVKYKKLRHTVSEPGDEQWGEIENEEEEVTVFLSSSSTPYYKLRRGRGNLCFRLFVEVLFLGVALTFVFGEWYGFWSGDSDLKDCQDSDHCWKTQKKEGLDHHHDNDSHEIGESHSLHNNSSHHIHEHLKLMYHHGVIITDSMTCSRAGKDILEDGGNLVDAGIASLLCLGVIHPHTAGVGGVFSGILYNHTTGISKAIHVKFHGTLSTTHSIPATLQGIRYLHSQFGVFQWQKLFVSAIQLAKDGFPIDNSLALALKSNEVKICSSKLSELFCHRNGTVKALGSVVTNQRLSELLQSISVNDSSLLESLAMKLAEDLPLTERQDFVTNMQQCQGELSDPFIHSKEEYTIFASASSLAARIISNSINGIREQNTSLWSNASFFTNLLNTTRLIYKSAVENENLTDIAGLSMAGSFIGILDKAGNILVISSSLNSSFGSMQLLPSTGVILSDFDMHLDPLVSQWSCPLLIKLRDDKSIDNREEEEDEQLSILVTGGLSAPFVATQIIINKLYFGKPDPQAITSPFLHPDVKGSESLLACISASLDTSDNYKLSIDTENKLHVINECPDKSLALVMQKHVGHLTAYAFPGGEAYTDGY